MIVALISAIFGRRIAETSATIMKASARVRSGGRRRWTNEGWWQVGEYELVNRQLATI
jgi:hypothetical protein